MVLCSSLAESERIAIAKKAVQRTTYNMAVETDRLTYKCTVMTLPFHNTCVSVTDGQTDDVYYTVHSKSSSNRAAQQ